MKLRETIAAISTPPGRGGLGVIRVSGPQARAITEQIASFKPGFIWQPWRATLATLHDADGAVIDHVIVTWFAPPRSYTGEEQVEIACHGAPVILRTALDRLVAHGARLAEPGEFTLRAFLNGRIDLPRAEAIRDLIDSTTVYQARIAAQQADGSVSHRLRPLKEQMLELIALLEAGIDFAEDDIDVALDDALVQRLDALLSHTRRLADSYAYGRLVHDGFSLAIVGRPNAGKSSLFNRLVQQDRAIVTEIPGTTRDLVSETASLDGLPVKFIDTAGLRQGQDRVEQLGIERSYQAMADADLTLVVVDLSQPPDDFPLPARSILVGNKADLPRANSVGCLEVSALTGEGIDELRQAIRAELVPDERVSQEPGFITSLRQERLLRESLDALERGRTGAAEHVPHEMLLVDLYAALAPIDAITGATTADDILNRIFSTFCIGK